jgi:hypothetical protein
MFGNILILNVTVLTMRNKMPNLNVIVFTLSNQTSEFECHWVHVQLSVF